MPNEQKKENRVMLMERLKLSVEFEVVPAITTEFELTDSILSAEGERLSYRGGDYLFTVVKRELQDKFILDFTLKRTDNETFTTLQYCIRCVSPAVDVYNSSPMFLGYAHVSHHNPATFRSSCTTKDAPYVMYGSRCGENRFTIGLGNQWMETDVTRSGAGGYMYYDRNAIRFERPVAGVTLHQREISDSIYITEEKADWFHTTKGYWDFIDERRGYQPNPTPISAYGPSWCSWLYLTDIDEEKIWANALKAKELGIKTLMIDAGWFCADTDIPFPDSPLTNSTFGFGRIDSDGSKFSDMKGLVKRIHELGLYVWAWCTPRWAFQAVETGEGKVDQRLLDCRIIGKDGKTKPMLCTRHPDTREHAARFTSYLLKEYGFDGLKFDCWELEGDMDICCSDHEHDCDTMGEGTLKWGKAIYNAMTQVNRDAVVWLNNTVMKPYANYSCSPNEVYCQPDENWRMSVLLKTFSSGIVSHLCEGSWNPAEPDKALARQFCILMMGHVPEVQVDLTNLTPNHERIVKAHLAFYEAHREALLFGSYTPFGFAHMLGGPLSTTPPHVKIESEEEAFLFIGPVVCDGITLTHPPKRIYLMNLKNLDGLRVTLQGLSQGDKVIKEYDCFNNELSRKTVSSNGTLIIESSVGYGCMLSVETPL